VRLFNKHAKAKLDPEQASAAMLAALREREKRVCPLQCEAGFRVRGDTCVAVKAPPARSSARAERPVETRRPARVVREQPAPAPKQPTAAVDPAVPAGLMLLYGAGRLRVR